MSLESLRVAANPSVCPWSLPWIKKFRKSHSKDAAGVAAGTGEKPRVRKEDGVGNAPSAAVELPLWNASLFSRGVWIVPGAVRGRPHAEDRVPQH